MVSKSTRKIEDSHDEDDLSPLLPLDSSLLSEATILIKEYSFNLEEDQVTDIDDSGVWGQFFRRKGSSWALDEIKYFIMEKDIIKTLQPPDLVQLGGGRRGDVNLAKVLKFATSVEEEPILGFTLHPSLHFSERKSHLPTGNTCINRLMLTVPENGGKLPEEDVLFNFFDYAFCNAYYGLQ
ncbi:unnamed protein product [Mytilus edulis]|uniref:HECT domain-containing protein n=1 Tax=Mytilus edulis TaxID=6550 RepID=A0A8S3TTZ2_MYTED|nr:unnamed protein product [Mytilus edulis]